MFETGVRQTRLALAMVRGRPINPGLVEHLVEDARATLEEFGSPGDDVGQLIDGPFADPAMRRSFQTTAIRRTARRLHRQSPFYGERFAASGLDPAALTLDDLRRIPVTTKADLIERQPDFICGRSKPYLATRTTGTTGLPAEIWLSQYETRLWPALAALAGLLRAEITPRDCLQISISSRATAAVHQSVAMCGLVGARTTVLGIVPPDQGVDALLGRGYEAPTLLATYPSYLATLVAAARRRQLSPSDFRLRRIDVGGEVLSPDLAQAARTVLGCPEIVDTFAMTEVLPVTARTCDQGHLHHDVNMGLAEVVAMDGGRPAEPGELGTVVITPFYPYRECMPVFRYDTRDVVRRLPDQALTCSLAGLPGTSPVLGKAAQLIDYSPGTATTRDVVEILEGLPTQPWPCRFAVSRHDGHQLLDVPDTDLAGLNHHDVAARFAARGIEVNVRAVTCGPGDAERLRPVRSDLTETTFAAAGG